MLVPVYYLHTVLALCCPHNGEPAVSGEACRAKQGLLRIILTLPERNSCPTCTAMGQLHHPRPTAYLRAIFGQRPANPDYSRSQASLMNMGNVILSGWSQCAGC